MLWFCSTIPRGETAPPEPRKEGIMADNPVHELLDPKTDYYQVFADIEGEDLEWWKKARDFAEFARPYVNEGWEKACLLYTSPSPRDRG